MDGTGKAAYYKHCTACQTRVFVDLLDDEGRCPYCREIVVTGGELPIRLLKKGRTRNKKKADPT